MYSFKYNKASKVIEEVAFWIKMLSCVAIIASLLLCNIWNFPKILIEIAVVIFWVSMLCEGVSALYKAAVVSLPVEIKVNIGTELTDKVDVSEVENAVNKIFRDEAYFTVRTLQEIALNAQKSKLFNEGIYFTIIPITFIIVFIIF